MTVSCTKILEFDAGHRVYGHESKCAHPHGHRYKVEFTANGTPDSIGRVIDFSVLKDRVGTWLNDNWDHAFLVWDQDPAHMLMKNFPVLQNGSKIPPRVIVCPFNPTAENMADFLLRVICPRQLEGTGVLISEVVVWETPSCFARAKLA